MEELRQVVYAYNPSTWEAEARLSYIEVLGWSGLHNETISKRAVKT